MQYRPNARIVRDARAAITPRRYGVRILVAAALAALVAMPGLLASPTQAGPTLESAGSVLPFSTTLRPTARPPSPTTHSSASCAA